MVKHLMYSVETNLERTLWKTSCLFPSPISTIHLLPCHSLFIASHHSFTLPLSLQTAFICLSTSHILASPFLYFVLFSFLFAAFTSSKHSPLKIITCFIDFIFPFQFPFHLQPQSDICPALYYILWWFSQENSTFCINVY